VITPSGRRRSIGGGLMLAGVIAVGCSPMAPTTSAGVPGQSLAASPGVIGRDWGPAPLVEPPPGDPVATIPPFEGPNSLGHPGHYQGGEASVRDVASGGPGFVAVGYVLEATGPRATAWASRDGRSWTLARDFPGEVGSVAWSVATDGPTAVAVGSVNGAPAAWFSPDGVEWHRVASPPDSAEHGELRALTAGTHGFVAGGSDEGDRLAPRALFWTSTDGQAWQELRDSPGFTDARLEGLAALGGAFVAVGTAYAGKDPKGGVGWRSDDGRTWDRSPGSDDLAQGTMHAVTAGASGFLAVGTDLAGHRATVWSSSDGLAWKLAPDAPELDNYGLQIEMRDVAAHSGGYLAVGHLVFGTQYPTGIVWQSTDGLRWTRAPGAPVLEQVKFAALTVDAGRAIAVGDFGGPDAVIPTILLSPWPP
jgi:hypothetical protein